MPMPITASLTMVPTEPRNTPFGIKCHSLGTKSAPDLKDALPLADA